MERVLGACRTSNSNSSLRKIWVSKERLRTKRRLQNIDDFHKLAIEPPWFKPPFAHFTKYGVNSGKFTIRFLDDRMPWNAVFSEKYLNDDMEFTSGSLCPWKNWVSPLDLQPNTQSFFRLTLVTRSTTKKRTPHVNELTKTMMPCNPRRLCGMRFG